MASFEEVLSQAESVDHVRKRSCRVLLRQDLTARHEELDERLRNLPQEESIAHVNEAVQALVAEMDALEAEIEAALVTFTFRAVGHLRWANLMAAHPPTKEQRKENARLDHNPETFPIAAMAESCVEPEGATLDLFRRLEASSVPTTVFDTLWATCIEANLGGTGVPKSVAAGAIRRLNARSATTRAPAASPAASSSAA